MKVKQQLIRKYYKYVIVDKPWTQPVLSSNGTIGVDDFAVTAQNYETASYYHPWRAFQVFGSSGYWASTVLPNYYLIYSKTPIKLVNLYIYGPSDSLFIKDFTLAGSNDGNSWTDIQSFSNNSRTFDSAINNNNFYNYYKLYITSANTSSLGIKTITLTAYTQDTSIVESTADNYDFYEDVIALNAFVDNNVYKAKIF